MMRVIVTGGAGFIGSHLCERLVAAGNDVIAIDNFDPFYDAAIKRSNLRALEGNPAFRLVDVDIRDLPGAALDGGLIEGHVDVVVHLAAKAGVRPSLEQPMEYSRTNLDGTTGILELARQLGTKRFVFGSSSSVYGNNAKVPFAESDPVDHPISPYAATKRAGELICHTFHHLYGISLICLRFFTVYGPRQRPDLAIHKFTRLMSENQPIPLFGDGTMSRDYTYIDDILAGVEAAIRVTDSATPIYDIVNLGGSRTTTTAELIAMIGRELGVEPQIRRLPVQPGDVERTFADTTKAGRVLGYRPTTPIQEGLPRFVEWFREVAAARG